MISVIIPTHNRSEMLSRALNSVLTQTYSDFEVIIVDDASSDDTQQSFEKHKDTRVSYFRVDESKGGNFVRNLGVSYAKGEYVAFLDDDDEWMPNKLANQIELFEGNEKLGLVYTGAQVIHTEYGSDYHIKPRLQGDLSKKILTFNHIGTTSSVIMKKETFDAAGGFDLNMPQLQDYDLWIRVCQLCEIGCCKDSLIKYYVHSSGPQVTTSVLKNQQSIEIIDKKYADLLQNLTKYEQRNRFAQRYNAMGKRKLKSGENKEARMLFLRSLKLSFNFIGLKFYLASFFKYDTLITIKSKLFR